MRIIAFINNKGGVLKTTLVTNLAGVVASQGKKVLVIDTDPQGSVTGRFGIDADNQKHTLIDLFSNHATVEETTLKLYEDKISAIPSAFDLSMIEAGVQAGKIDPANIKTIFKKFKEIKGYDYIFFDCAPTFGRMTNEIIRITDEIVVPTELEKDSIKGLTNTISVLETQNIKDKLKWVVPTKVRATKLHIEALEQWVKPLAKKHGFKISNNPIKLSIQASTSTAIAKIPLTLTKSKSDAKEVYFRLAKELEI